VDVIEGRGPAPSLVIPLIQRLPDDSMTAALAAGGTEQFGWGSDRHLLASVYDALNLNTRATGNWKGKPPKLPEYPRPSTRKKKQKPRTVADLFATMNRR
jgi:hypothetical protein